MTTTSPKPSNCDEMAQPLPRIAVQRSSPNLSWFAVYVAIRQYAPIVRFIVVSPDEVSITLLPAERIAELQQLNEVACGAVTVPIIGRDCNIFVPAHLQRSAQNADVDDHRPSILAALNRDCLGGILELRALAVQDLCTIARTSADLTDIAELAFWRRFRASTIHLGHGLSWSPANIESLFLNFGAHIRRLRLDYPGPFGDVVLAFAAVYCPNIEELRCNRLAGMATAIDRRAALLANGRHEVPAPFAALQRLELLARASRDPVSMWDRTACELPCVHLPSLRHLDVHSARISGESMDFFAINSGLQVLRMHRTVFSFGLQPLLGHLAELRALVMSEVDWNGSTYALGANITCFARLSKLEQFEFSSSPCIRRRADEYYTGMRILAVMHAAKVPIRWLKMRTNRFPAIVKAMRAIEVAEFYDLDDFGVSKLNAYVETDPGVRLICEASDVGGRMMGFRRNKGSAEAYDGSWDIFGEGAE